MTQSTTENQESVLAAVLFNSGLQAYRVGHTDTAMSAFAQAVRLDPQEASYAVVACKASFGVGKFDEARSYLLSADAAGLESTVFNAMYRDIERAITVSTSNRVPVKFVPGPPDPPKASWALAFCDWLESIVHECCQELRALAANVDTE